MRRTSSNGPLHDSLTLDSSPGNDLFSRRALKKGNRNLNASQLIKPQLEYPAGSRRGSWVQIPSGNGIFSRVSVDAISIVY